MNNEQINELLKQLQEEWAPALLATAARIVFWDSVGWLILGGICAALCGLLLRWANDWIKTDQQINDDDTRSVCVFFSGVGAVVFGGVALALLLNIWNWIGVFDSQLAVAHRVLDMITRGR